MNAAVGLTDFTRPFEITLYFTRDEMDDPLAAFFCFCCL